MREMLLLGAGASVEAGVPDSHQMSDRILAAFEEKFGNTKYTKVISFVIGGLLFQNGIKGLNPLKTRVNVEELFNAIELLRDRHAIEAAPFIGSWHALVEDFDRIEPYELDTVQIYRVIYRSIAQEITKSVPTHTTPFGGRNIDNIISQVAFSKQGISLRSLSQEINKYVLQIIKDWTQKLDKIPYCNPEFENAFRKVIEQQTKLGGGEIFNQVAEYMIHTLIKIASIEGQEKVVYLRPLLNVLKTQKQLVIATLNYDNSIELLTSAGVNCSTCIEEWSSTGVFKSKDEAIVLLKLHGSIDWAATEGVTDVQRPLPYTVIKRVSVADVKKAGFVPAVIFGHRNKLTADGPFLDILRYFQAKLEKTDRLTIIGYSFGDEHINVYLGKWLNQHNGRVIRIIDPKFSQNKSKFALQLRRLKDRVQILEKTAGDGIAQAFGTQK